MKWKELKYLFAFVAPMSAYWGIWAGGIWSPSAVYVAFLIIPILEVISPRSKENLNPIEESQFSKNSFFDFLLYLNVPILYGLISYFVYTFLYRSLSIWELAGMIASIGMIIGTQINVAHELGHKNAFLPRWLSRLLLLPALYNHFTLEHNLGHHKNVGTYEDPATSRKNEMLYFFWIRCITGTYRNAWTIQMTLLNQGKSHFLSFKNELLWAHIGQLAYLICLYVIGGPILLMAAISAAIIGILLLESVNYIEHYGLTRKRLPSGRHERVETFHSWNANHEVGRIFLYELTRHSDHHYKSTRPYQILRHWEISPQLPHGYPLSIILSMIPPIWFKLMNPKVEEIKEQMQNA